MKRILLTLFCLLLLTAPASAQRWHRFRPAPTVSPPQTGISPGPSQETSVPLTWLDFPRTNYTPGNYGKWLQFGGKSRYYELHLPNNYNPNIPYPLVIVLHGGAGNAALARYDSQMDLVADREGFIVLYPAGSSKENYTDRKLYWNCDLTTVPESYTGQDDVGFISLLIDDVDSYFNVDLHMVYTCGRSNGSYMSFKLMADLKHRLAAMGGVAGIFGPDKFAFGSKVPLIYFHGTEDNRVSYTTSQDLVLDWVAFNKAISTPYEFTIGQADLAAFRANRLMSGEPVSFWTLNGGGHTWPGGKTTAVEETLLNIGSVNQDIYAADLMWKFFEQHKL